MGARAPVHGHEALACSIPPMYSHRALASVAREAQLSDAKRCSGPQPSADYWSSRKATLP